MKEYEYLDELISRYPVLAPVKADIRTAYETLKECYERGGKLLIAGNGGSCADSVGTSRFGRICALSTVLFSRYTMNSG